MLPNEKNLKSLKWLTIINKTLQKRKILNNTVMFISILPRLNSKIRKAFLNQRFGITGFFSLSLTSKHEIILVTYHICHSRIK